MLWILDSWNAVAIAIDVARGGRPRRCEIAAISDAHLACSRSISALTVPTWATQNSVRRGLRSRSTVATRIVATTSPRTTNQRNRTSSVGVQVGVELDARALTARPGLDGPGLAVG